MHYGYSQTAIVVQPHLVHYEIKHLATHCGEHPVFAYINSEPLTTCSLASFTVQFPLIATSIHSYLGLFFSLEKY